MCSVNEIDGEQALCMRRSDTFVVGSTCRKCSENKAEVVLRTKHAYCSQCFLKMANHKFRSSLGRSKIVRANDNVMIAYSGSQASAALLHLVSVGMNETTHKRLRFMPCIMYVDEGVVLGQSQEERLDICKLICNSIEKYDIPKFVTCLEMACSEDKLEILNLESHSEISVTSESEKPLKQLFDSVESLTSKEDLLRILRTRILLKAAKKLNCSKIFIADTATGLATTLLANVSLGRGAHLPLDIGFCDDRDRATLILRPLHDFMKKEIVYYNLFNELDTVLIPSLGSKVSPYESIQKLTEKFVVELQQDFPSTASVIFRTGEKLSVSNDRNHLDDSCALCGVPLDVEGIKSSSVKATEFSHITSKLGSAAFSNNSIKAAKLEVQETCQEIKENGIEDCLCERSCNISESSCRCHREVNCKKEIAVDSKNCLCYGCRLIVKEMKNSDYLPLDVRREMKKLGTFQSMQNEIADFLL